jgi:hypothetical protein
MLFETSPEAQIDAVWAPVEQEKTTSSLARQSVDAGAAIAGEGHAAAAEAARQLNATTPRMMTFRGRRRRQSLRRARPAFQALLVNAPLARSSAPGNFPVIAILAPHVLARVEPPPATRDPFDRLLLARCALEGMRLVTIDRALVDHPAAYAPT